MVFEVIITDFVEVNKSPRIHQNHLPKLSMIHLYLRFEAVLSRALGAPPWSLKI